MHWASGNTASKVWSGVDAYARFHRRLPVSNSFEKVFEASQIRTVDLSYMYT